MRSTSVVHKIPASVFGDAWEPQPRKAKVTSSSKEQTSPARVSHRISVETVGAHGVAPVDNVELWAAARFLGKGVRVPHVPQPVSRVAATEANGDDVTDPCLTPLYRRAPQMAPAAKANDDDKKATKTASLKPSNTATLALLPWFGMVSAA